YSAPPFHGCGTRLTPHPCPLGWHCHQISPAYQTSLFRLKKRATQAIETNNGKTQMKTNSHFVFITMH
ncbi:hypothetical protein, partial [Agrobacterium sp. NPDC089420]|uniref:hypothetical protein n=1 Tax=Agrobacterium sp. NPDC089420 TaxID=3363918 RepID=UPI00384F39B2